MLWSRTPLCEQKEELYSPWLKGVHSFKSGGRDVPACGNNRGQWDPLDHLESQKPVVPSCLVKEILEKRFEVEQPANISQGNKKNALSAHACSNT